MKNVCLAFVIKILNCALLIAQQLKVLDPTQTVVNVHKTQIVYPVLAPFKLMLLYQSVLVTVLLKLKDNLMMDVSVQVTQNVIPTTAMILLATHLASLRALADHLQIAVSAQQTQNVHLPTV